MRSRRHWVSWSVACAAVLSVAAQAHADEVTLFAARDTTLYEAEMPLSNGAGAGLFAGPNGARLQRRALMAFNVESAVPMGAKIRNVVLRLQLSRSHARPTPLALHRLTAAWGEAGSRASGEEGGGGPATDGDATWKYRLWPTEPWQTPGGDYAATPSASTSVVDLAPYTWTGPQLVDDAQRFLDAPETNHGWILLSANATGAVAERFESRESASGNGPQLRIVYDPPAATTGACCMPDGSCGVSVAPGASCPGTYMGAGTVCQMGTCPPVTGACCAADATATCAVREKGLCDRAAWRGANTSCDPNPCPVILTPFVDPLPLPSAAIPVEGQSGRAASYRMSMVQVSQSFHRDLPKTTVWGFDDGVSGGYPGPTIEARSGEPVVVVWANDLRDEDGRLRKTHALSVDTCLHGAQDAAPRTVVHLHGGRVPSEFDGQPDATLLPGEQARYEYPNAQRAATIWYHDHAVGITRLNVYMGLAGFYLIRDETEEALDLPRGKYEVPLAIQDRSFNPDGSLRYPATWQEAFFGDNAVVNGKVSPYLEVDRGKYRFRLLNGSTSRTYALSLSNGYPLIQIGNDGGLLPEPTSMQELILAPGERADVIVDFQYSSAKVVLKNRAKSPFPSGSQGPALSDILKFVVGDEPGHTKRLPATLSSVPEPVESEAVMTRDLVIDRAAHDHCGQGMWLINDKDWDEVTEKPHLGTSEIWRFVNRSGVTHPMHIHSLFFQVLDRQLFKLENGELVPQGAAQPPKRNERGFKDTVQVGPFEATRVLARFEDFAGRFPYHCHLIEHEDHGMMRQFESVAVCGDGALARGHEACDDGNLRNGDGCSTICQLELETSTSSAVARENGGCSVSRTRHAQPFVLSVWGMVALWLSARGPRWRRRVPQRRDCR